MLDPAAGAPSGAGSAPADRSPMSSTGTMTSSSSGLVLPTSTTDTGRGVPSGRWPPRNRAISSRGRWVADRPIRCGGRCVISSSRSRLTARWLPRLVAATAWISSMMTACDVAERLARRDVSMR